MRNHIESCKASGKSVVSYCQETGIAPSKFYYWQKRLQATAIQPGFTQIAAPPPVGNATATVHFPKGVHITFTGNINATILKELACCI
jgi:hypothetical protein